MMGWNVFARRATATALWLFGLTVLASMPSGCDLLDSLHSGGSGGGSGSGVTGSSGGSGAVTGCGIACDAQTPCPDPSLACLPSSKGGTECKPASCPACPSGQYCAYDPNTCQALGCTSDACGFAIVGPCDSCVQAHCCSQSLACGNDPACNQLVTCIAGCNGSTSCESACESSAGTVAVQELQTMDSCDQASCLGPCYGTTPDAGSDTGSGSGGSCDFVWEATGIGNGTGTCASVAVTNAPGACGESGGVNIVLTNNCTQAIYCELSAESAIPPGLGGSSGGATPSGMTIQPGGTDSVQGCSGATQPAGRCVLASEAEKCMGVDAGGPPANDCTSSSYPIDCPYTAGGGELAEVCCPSSYPVCGGCGQSCCSSAGQGTCGIVVSVGNFLPQGGDGCAISCQNYCQERQQDACCAAEGRPDISCPPGSYCSPVGGCQPNGCAPACLPSGEYSPLPCEQACCSHACGGSSQYADCD